METDSDAGLLRRFVADRSEAAFAELVNRHLGRVYGVALRKVGGDSHLAQDVAQTVFVSLSRKAATLAQREVIGGWLYHATHLAAVAALRTRTRRQTREMEAHIMNQGDETTSDHAELGRLLDETMHELGDADRDAVWLRFFEELSFAQIGERLHLSENAARMRVDRALDKLNGRLARRGITSTAGAVGAALANQAFGEVPAGLGGQVVAGGVATLGKSGLSGAGVLFMSNLKLMGGSALLGGILAASWSAVEWSRAPQPAVAILMPGAPKGAREQEQRDAGGKVVPEPSAPAQPAPAVPAAATSAVRRNAQGIPITSSQMQSKIRGNLMSLKSARNMALKFDGHVPASVAELVGPNGRLRQLDAVNGEDYSSLDLSASRFKVTAADGIEVEYDAGVPKAEGPATRQETAQWEAELAAYVSPPVDPAQGIKVRNEYDAALLAIAELKKREGWESGFSLFRPETIGPAKTTWYVQFNHHTDFRQDGKMMRTSVHVDVWVRDDGKITKYDAGAPRTNVMPE